MPVQLSGTYYTVADAAQEAGVTVGRIRQMYRDGELEVVPIDGRSYLIPASEVKRIAKPTGIGRPRGPAKEKIA